MSASFFFYDYETTGIDPKRDRIIQFAGIRTDEDFNMIAKPIAEYCKLSADIIPNPEALLITGISHDTLETKGLNEIEFMRKIYQEFAQSSTCVAGYNNIRFDDEFTRFSFYRNFYDPYAREWQNNNTRWDLIDVVRMCAALRPDGIIWPKNPDGRISFKLEAITAANGLEHKQAHDALSDVYATIALAKLIHSKQPKLLKYLLNCRKKSFVNSLVDFNNNDLKNKDLNSKDLQSKLIVHSSAMISSEFYATSVFLPLMLEPGNQNSIIAWDLRYDPKILLDIGDDVEQACRLLYTPQQDLLPGEQRLALKNIFANKVPAIAPFSTVDDNALARIKVERNTILNHAQQLIANKHLWSDLVQQIYSKAANFVTTDVEQQLYDKFIENNDKYLCNRVHLTASEQLYAIQEQFSDSRLKELLFRYRARNFPECLSDSEAEQWQGYVYKRWESKDKIASLSKSEFITKVEALLSGADIQAESRKVLTSWLQVMTSNELVAS